MLTKRPAGDREGATVRGAREGCSPAITPGSCVRGEVGGGCLEEVALMREQVQLGRDRVLRGSRCPSKARAEGFGRSKEPASEQQEPGAAQPERLAGDRVAC